MRVCTDDTVYRVDNRFLGPQGFTIARVGIRYQAIGIGFLLWIPLALGLRSAGLAGFVGALAATAVTVALTLLIMQFVDHDRPVAAQLTVLAHEIGAPRPVRGRNTATLSPAHVPVTAQAHASRLRRRRRRGRRR